MPASNVSMIHKLQSAINGKGEKLLLDKVQFFSDDENRPVTLYIISRPEYTKNGKRKKEKLFETASQIQIVLFLRDYWYHINGWEIPTDNEMWEEVKAKKGITYEVNSNG